MSTKARLGIDIVGVDKTRAAFSSAQRSLAAFAKTAKMITAFLGVASVATILKKFSRSIIDVNKNLEPIKNSFTLIDRAWQQFALNVGKAGVNEAMMLFNKTMAQMIVGLGGLSGTIGSFLSGSINGLRVGLHGAGRAAAFLYDNIEIFKKALMGIAFYVVIKQVIVMARGFVLAVSAIRAAGIATTLFAMAQRRMLILWVVIIGLTAKLTGSYDALKGKVDELIDAGEKLLPLIGDQLISGLNSLGFETKSLTVGLDEFDGKLKNLPKTFEEVATGIKAGTPALEAYKKAMVSLKQFVIGLSDQAIAVGKTEGATTRLAQSQLFYNKMQEQGISLTYGQKVATEAWLDKIPNAIAALERQKSTLQTAQDVGEAFKSTFSSAFASVVDGTLSVAAAFKSMAISLLSTLTNLFANKAFSMLIQGSPSDGGAGGLVGALFKGLGGISNAAASPIPGPTFNGLYAKGGTLGAGNWGIAGENGPEAIVGPATIIPSVSGGNQVNVTVKNYVGARVETRQDSRGNPIIELHKMVADVVDGRIQGRYGVKPAQVRR